MLHYNFNPFKLTIVKFVFVLSAFVLVINAVLLLYRAVYSYNEELEKAYSDAESLTKTVSGHIELTFLAVDVVLKRAVEKHQSNLLFGKTLSQDTQNNIISWVDSTPQVSAMLMADEQGKIYAIYRKQGFKPWMEGKDYISGKDYFKTHVDSFDELYVGSQKSYLKDSHDFIVLSRRLNKLNGEFDGVIMAVVNNQYIKSFFKSIEKNKSTELVINHQEGENLLSTFEGNNTEYKDFLSYKNPASKSLNPNQITMFDNGVEYSKKLRVYSLIELPAVLMEVGIIFNGRDILSDWLSERYSDIIFYLIFLFFVFLIGFFSLELAKKVQKLKFSERKALAASKAKSDFLANMSHELRTPLNAIIGFSEMLMSEYFGKVNDKQKERLNDIHGCGNHLLSLINEVLDFSKGQAGKLELQIEELQLHKIAREVVRLFEERAKKDDVNVINDVSKNLPYIAVDRRKIKQIMINLLSNAIKFCRAGGSVSLFARVNEKGNYEIIVKDEGVGMSREDIPKALTAFGQVHSDSAVGGTGLGLPLCKIFAELHEGKLSIDSELGKGTTVTVELPKKVILGKFE